MNDPVEQSLLGARDLLQWVDTTIRGALVWAGDKWGSKHSVEWAVNGVVTRLRLVTKEKDELRAEVERLKAELTRALHFVADGCSCAAMLRVEGEPDPKCPACLARARLIELEGRKP